MFYEWHFQWPFPTLSWFLHLLSVAALVGVAMEVDSWTKSRMDNSQIKSIKAINQPLCMYQKLTDNAWTKSDPDNH